MQRADIIRTEAAIDNNEGVYNKQQLEKDKKVSPKISGKQHEHTVKHKMKKGLRLTAGISCSKCQKVFQKKGEFESHYRATHKEPPMYTCSLCCKSMAKYSSYRSHYYRHMNDQRYKCEECPKSFGLQTQLNVHIRSKHMHDKPYECDDCGKKFVTKPGLALHVKKHQKDLPEDFPCPECGKVLLTRGGLATHMNAHREGRRFMCDVCGKTFTQKINLQQHAKQHIVHRPFICDQCGNTFTDPTELSRHYSRHSTKRPFKCDACGKMYKTERCLKVHTQVHGTERPFRCDVCDKGFLNKSKLQQHHNIHTGERPFACNFCERKFTNYPNWLKHTRRRHSEANNAKKMMNAETSSTNKPSFKSVAKQSLKPNRNQIVQIPELVAEDYETLLKFDHHFLDDVRSIGDTLPDLLPNLEASEAVHHDSLTTDFKLSKTDELYLQRSILNFPMTEMSSNEMNLQVV